MSRRSTFDTFQVFWTFFFFFLAKTWLRPLFTSRLINISCPRKNKKTLLSKYIIEKQMKSEAGRQASELVSEPLDCFKKREKKEKKTIYSLFYWRTNESLFACHFRLWQWVVSTTTTRSGMKKLLLLDRFGSEFEFFFGAKKWSPQIK